MKNHDGGHDKIQAKIIIRKNTTKFKDGKNHEG